MGKLIDLSRTIENNMPVFPGDSPPTLMQNRYLSIDHYNDHHLEISMHAGTHIDGPMHLTESQEYIADLPLESFLGQGCWLDVRNQTMIDAKADYETLIRPGNIVLLYTGWDKFFGQPTYFENYPVISEAMAKLLIQKKVKLIGMDTPSPDKAPYSIHKLLLKSGIYIIENLTNLDKLNNATGFEVIALPLKIKANGSMARVIARITR